MSRRDRPKKGKSGQLRPGWAPLWEDVLTTEAVKSLPPAYFKFYIVVCALCKPYFNGAIPLSRKVLKESFGITSAYTVHHGIKLLIERKLIVRTRKARPKHSAMYGVTHLPLNQEAMRKEGISVRGTDQD